MIPDLTRVVYLPAIILGAVVACGEPAAPQTPPLSTPPPPSPPPPTTSAPTTTEPAVVDASAAPMPEPPPVPEAGASEIADASAPVVAIADASVPDAQAPEPTFTPIAGANTRTTFKWYMSDVRGAAITNAGIAGPKIRDVASKLRGAILMRAMQCFRSGLNNDPTTAGRMTYTITVRPDGTVDGTPTVQASDLPMTVRRCVTASARAVEFAATGAAQPTMIRLTIVLFPP